MKRYYSFLSTPVDELLLLSNGEGLSGVYMDAQKHRPDTQENWQRDDKLFATVKQQLRAYFAKELQKFDLPLRPAGTEFQCRVWQSLQQIPFGHTWSYQQLANHIGSPKAVRAVGLANGKNPIGIIIPCHRVIGSNGKLTGYAGGLNRKQWLLDHEASQGLLFSA